MPAAAAPRRFPVTTNIRRHSRQAMMRSGWRASFQLLIPFSQYFVFNNGVTWLDERFVNKERDFKTNKAGPISLLIPFGRSPLPHCSSVTQMTPPSGRFLFWRPLLLPPSFPPRDSYIILQMGWKQNYAHTQGRSHEGCARPAP